MARKKRRNRIGGPFSPDELLTVGDSLFKLQVFHAKMTERSGHLITKFEAQTGDDITPDVYIVSGKARAQLREFVAKMIATEENGTNELERMYRLSSGDNRAKGAANGN